MIAQAAGPAMAALVILAIAGWAWHSVTEHHVHLLIARTVNPAVVVPPTRHDTRWHAMSHRARFGVNAAMLAAAGCLGLAWQLARTAATVMVIIVLALTVFWAAVRLLSRAIGKRDRHPVTGLPPEE